MKWFILLILFSSLAQAKAYKCKTAAGKTTYQQSPCKSDESVNDYKHREESEATKASLEKSRKEIEEKRIANAKLKKQIELDRHEGVLRDNKERLSGAQANLREAEAKNADAVADYNRGISDRVKIKNRYIDKVLNNK